MVIILFTEHFLTMDINTIIESSFNNTRTSEVQGTLPKSSFVKTTSGNVCAKKMSDWQEDALLSLKKDPAVLAAKVSIKGEDVSYSQNTEQQRPNTPTEFQPRSTQEAKLNRLDFESKMCMERAALLSLPSDQLSLILKYVQILRQQRISLQKRNECGFCKNNRQPEVWYNTHVLKDTKGRVRCPVLRSYVCPLCGATGDNAHTITHCRNTWSH